MVVIIQGFAQAHARPSIQGVLAQMNVVPAGGVLEKINDAHGVGAFPAVIKPHFGDQLLHGIFQRELAFI